jgi:alpha-glucosidase
VNGSSAQSQTGPPFDGVIYQIYPRSFRDGNGDGIGDLAGMRAGLEHLAWLGVDAVWSSPLYRSPMADFGYDVADHCDVDPVFGTLAELDMFVAEAEAHGLEVWLDFVPNHTSDRHRWFEAARSSRDDAHRDWYVWRDPAPDGGPPNNWKRHFADAPAWTLDERTGQYYLHHFLPEQPDVNWDTPALREAQLDVLRFWMNRGVRGFRADVVHLIGQDRSYPDDPPDSWDRPGRGDFHHHPSTREHLREIRRVLDVRGAVIVGESYLEHPEVLLAHVGDDAQHLSFVFHLLLAPWDAAEWARRIREVEAVFAPAGAWASWALGNHDQPRLATRLGSEGRARVAATVQLTLRGVPCIFQGDELGLEDAIVPAERVVDPGGRDGCRAPVPWTTDEGAGWPATAWLPLPPHAAARSVAAQRSEAASTANLYRRLLALRHARPALVRGTQRVLDAGDGLPEGVLGLERSLGDDVLVTLAEMSGRTATLDARWSTGWRVVIDSLGVGEREGSVFDGTLAPDCALVLERG